MGKLNQHEIDLIIEKAQLLKKISENSNHINYEQDPSDIDDLLEVTDSLGIGREQVVEAYTEYMGVPVEEPIIIDTNDINSTKVTGRASGMLTNSLLTELKAQTEFHFNMRGSIVTRKNKVIWSAMPEGLGRLFSSNNDTRVEFKQHDVGTSVTVHKSLRTLNKFYIPALIPATVSLGMLGAVIFGGAGNDAGPLMVFGILFAIGSILYTRFISNKKKKVKKNLSELVETLQGIMERRFKVIKRQSNSTQNARSVLDELENSEETMNESEYTKSVRSKS